MFIIPFLFVLLLDQTTKLWASYTHQVAVNSGISFAWFREVPPSLMTIFIGAVAIWLALRFRYAWIRHAFLAGIFWGGVVSNIIDRLLLGGVSDWLVMPFIAFKNNIADIAIGSATFLLLVVAIKERYARRHFI